jgi:hypothetical protein
VDDANRAICLVIDPAEERAPIEAAARAALLRAGLDLGGFVLEVVSRTRAEQPRRVRLGPVTATAREGGVEVEVVLEWGERRVSRGVVGESGESLEIRSAALATVDAVDALLGDDTGVRLIGTKLFRAFDADLLAVSLRRPGPPPLHFVGAVRAGSDRHTAAAMAVLNALNRILGNDLNSAAP